MPPNHTRIGVPLMAVDALLAAVAYGLAYLVRFEGGPLPAEQWTNLLAFILPFTALKLLFFRLFNLHRGMWRFTSVHDLAAVAKAATLASLVMLAALLIAQRFHGFSRSVFLLDWLFTMLLVGGVRVIVRIATGMGRPDLSTDRFVRLLRGRRHPAARRRCLLFGAGTAAESLLRDLEERSGTGVEVVAIFDDDHATQGLRLHGVPVEGTLDDVEAWLAAQRLPVQEALIALPEAAPEAMRRAVAVCERAGLGYRTIPSLREIASGHVSVSALREVDYRDLLPRETARPERERIAAYLTGKRVLVTGAGGSIGSELCRQIAHFEPASLLLVEMDESSLYTISMELEHERGFAAHVPLLGTLADRDWTEWVFAKHAPHVVFHAAAYKHVPMLELHPWQAVTNNVLATEMLLDIADEHGVERTIIVSTDKAVNPANVMGATKRLTERLMQCRRGGAMKLAAVRFGNVLGSSGSVIPLFRRQIAHGGPVTVTHPDMTRFFMTVEEACLLILQAGAMGRDAEIFVLNMGNPVKIIDLARDLIRLSGKEPDADVEIRITGLRPGEKLTEELISAEEHATPSEHEQILVLEEQSCPTAGAYAETLRALAEASSRRDAAALCSLLAQAVPEYRPNASASVGEATPESHAKNK
ncbi:polysaccharide biosynthesis protein [Oceanidesulfovibrio indonesiensis]|uniref:Polysaccharide biosynthesis protein n=1 Tax=Oceanidesulfovibrio indonesiensis TaxID=54767 RepID=A0A7M3MEC0_9BACT|nr:nucleoside-diphosphate sugar epimerase/dehydratase [Oceanidesulfovibrio indonesiensis]TVM17155.1 polysaccharide biosynthesis protein [Oceanidesulfovibrio indonesiensis]